MLALSRQKIHVLKEKPVTVILYKTEYRKVAIDLAKKYRDNGIMVEMIRKSSRKEVEDYKELATRNAVKQMLYVKSNDEVLVIDMENGTEKVMDTAE